MEYNETIRLRDGRSCVLRSGTEKDAQAVLDSFILTHAETEFLTTYPDEMSISAEEEGRFLQEKAESANEADILAELDGRVVGTAGIKTVGARDKLRHRAQFGISIERANWGLGIGRALTRACITCAETAGYAQLELEVVADNERAIALYGSEGFTEYGRNPRGFRTRGGRWQELVLMRRELCKGDNQ